jgi:deoxyribodipyrimidine photolyase
MTEAPAGSTLYYVISLSSKYVTKQSFIGLSYDNTQTQASLSIMNIPLNVYTRTPRRTIPAHVVSILTSFNATRLYANIEYELDELRRDISICGIAKDKGISIEMTHDRCIVEPGVVQTKGEKTYTVSYLSSTGFS